MLFWYRRKFNMYLDRNVWKNDTKLYSLFLHSNGWAYRGAVGLGALYKWNKTRWRKSTHQVAVLKGFHNKSQDNIVADIILNQGKTNSLLFTNLTVTFYLILKNCPKHYVYKHRIKYCQITIIFKYICTFSELWPTTCWTISQHANITYIMYFSTDKIYNLRKLFNNTSLTHT